MTKQLAPIEEFTKFGMREHRGLTVFNDVELELVRQAIIRDFVKSQHPRAYMWKCNFVGDMRFEELGDGRVPPSGTVPLFELSERIEK